VALAEVQICVSGVIIPSVKHGKEASEVNGSPNWALSLSPIITLIRKDHPQHIGNKGFVRRAIVDESQPPKMRHVLAPIRPLSRSSSFIE
jgi:hypothetical protein